MRLFHRFYLIFGKKEPLNIPFESGSIVIAAMVIIANKYKFSIWESHIWPSGSVNIVAAAVYFNKYHSVFFLLFFGKTIKECVISIHRGIHKIWYSLFFIGHWCWSQVNMLLSTNFISDSTVSTRLSLLFLYIP